MSRRQRAAIAASFGYVQYGLAMFSGLVLVPLTLHYLGARPYGLWLATAELLGYAALVDPGTMGVLPWMLAEADGRRDSAAIRELLANGAVVAALVGVGYATTALILWLVLPGVLHLTAADRSLLGGPLAVAAICTMVTYPLRVFTALITGLQDVRFHGTVGLVQVLGSLVITLVMLQAGHGLYALAVAAAWSSAVPAVACAGRAAITTPELIRHWPRPSRTVVYRLLTNGLGGWFGAFGWQLVAASNSLVITAVGRPEWVPVYACTARLGAMATQVVWLLPDAGLIGLAQLSGERCGPARLRQVVEMMLRLHLLLAGAAACVVLAINPLFVGRWVGEPLFGGMKLHTLLGLAIVLASLTHGLLAAAAVLGNRLRVGAITLLNGVLQVPCALVLVRIWGLAGLPAAALLMALATALPAGIALLKPVAEITLRGLVTGVVRPWAVRAVWPISAGALTGAISLAISPWWVAGLTALVAGLYVWSMRPFYALLPLGPSWNRVLVSFRLISAAPVSAEQP